jgi:deoxyribodipyrimidine photo-lyase
LNHHIGLLFQDKINKVGKVNIFWFRRDLRLHDNRGLFESLNGNLDVIPVFIFDTHILNELEEKDDARVSFIHAEISKIKAQLQDLGSDLLVYYGKADEVWARILEDIQVDTIYTNRDYEPYARKRDSAVLTMAEQRGVAMLQFKDHVIFEEKEVVKNDGDPYVVFTPYKKQWMKQLASATESDSLVDSQHLKHYPSELFQAKFASRKPKEMIALSEMGFEKSSIPIPDREVKQGIIREYGKKRNFPAENGTSRLGIHYRFGTISIREKAKRSIGLSETYLNELIWRDFYAQILANYPHVADGPFRQKYEGIEWRNNEEEFHRWCEGTTGYPIVDAGMRELNTTGYMHNRVRMITASFLTKHLLINWQWGEAYFAKKLLDFDLASNNGGWQWAAGCGTDAAPYFRIFNPYTQATKFDKDRRYIKKWVPEVDTDAYPEPIVEHKFARERCLRVYKEGLDQN